MGKQEVCAWMHGGLRGDWLQLSKSSSRDGGDECAWPSRDSAWINGGLGGDRVQPSMSLGRGYGRDKDLQCSQGCQHINTLCIGIGVGL
eukprot:1162097-Pelagomonas_calceolata.AAC.8